MRPRLRRVCGKANIFSSPGEGKFEDGTSHDPSGAATPVSNVDGPPAAKKAKTMKGGLSKKAKTVKQRLAVIDGDV